MRQRYVTTVFLALAAGVTVLALQAFQSPSGEQRSTSGSPGPVTIGEPSALLLGDGYLLPRSGACSPIRATGLACNVHARRHVGYVSPGTAVPNPGTLLERLPAARARFLADLIVVDAGRADVSYSEEQVADAITAYLSEVRATWPRARIVIFEPYRIGSTEQVFSDAVLSQLRATAQTVGADVVSPVAEGWTTPNGAAELVTPTGIRLTPRGIRFVSDRLASELRRLNLTDLPVTDTRVDSARS